MAGENDVQKSNFGTDSFELTNTGGKQIAAVFVDFRDALYRDSVIDFDGTAGDTAKKGFAPENGANDTGAITSNADSDLYFLPGEDPLPNDTGTGNGSTGGWRGVMIRFDGSDGGFENGEVIGFSGDMDPNSVAGLEKNGGNGIDPGSIGGDRGQWDVGGVSGAELIGSAFTVLFDDGTTATGYMGSDGSVAGSVGTAVQDREVKAASVTVNGTDSANVGVYGGLEPEIIVTGVAGDTVVVTMTKGLNPVLNDSNGIAQLVADRLADSHPEFEANNAADFQSVRLTIGADGTVTVPAGAFDYNNASNNGQDYGDGSAFTNGFDTAPIAVGVAVVGGDDTPLGPVDRVYAKSNGTAVDSSTIDVEGYFGINGSGSNNAYFKIQMEDENGSGGTNPGGKWSFLDAADELGNQNGFQGNGYYLFGSETNTGIDNGTGGNEMLEYTIYVGEDDLGTYDFSFAVSRDGNRLVGGEPVPGDQQNDIWLNFKHAEDAGVGVFEEFLIGNGDNEIEPANNGFAKVFGGPQNGNWGNASGIDGAPGNFGAEIEITEAGLYTVQIDGRSQGYHVDYFELYKGGNPGGGSANSTFNLGEPGDNGGGGGPVTGTVVIPVDSVNDDWEERGGGTSGDLELGLNGAPQYVGIRFDDIDIPEGSELSEAYIRFTALEGATGTAQFSIQIEDDETAAEYSNASTPGSRDYTDDEFIWNAGAWDVGETYNTVDISDMIEDMIGSDGVTDGAFGFLINPESAGASRVAHPFGSSEAAPELVLVFANDDPLAV